MSKRPHGLLLAFILIAGALSSAARPVPAAASLVRPESDIRLWAGIPNYRQVFPGSDLDFNISVANSGPDTAANVLIRMDVPAGTTFLSFTGSSQSFSDGRQTTQSVPGNITAQTPAVGSTGTMLMCIKTQGVWQGFNWPPSSLWVRLRVDASLAQGTAITGTATAVRDRTPVELAFCPGVANDPVLENDSAGATVFAKGPADVSLQASVSEDPVEIGRELRYTIVLTNAGPIVAEQVRMRDVYPPPWTTFVAFHQLSGPASDISAPHPGEFGQISTLTSAVEADTSAVFELLVRVRDDAPAGTRVSLLTFAESETGDPDLENNRIIVSTTLAAAPTLTPTVAPTPTPDVAPAPTPAAAPTPTPSVAPTPAPTAAPAPTPTAAATPVGNVVLPTPALPFVPAGP
ncbi:MAG TPA: hypothetical protein VJP45_00610 [Candidatus Limnocylindria bacterium]|nr:hypothetical protein [Candidatus Limnocylindria bacterium]